MSVDHELVDAAIELARTRFPGEDWSGAAALRLDDGTILTSVAPDVPNTAVSLCHETGAICEAFKLGRRVVASVCVTAADDNRGYWILAPCGVCQERLFTYGPDVEVPVPDPKDPHRWHTLRLRDVQPHRFARRSRRMCGRSARRGRTRVAEPGTAGPAPCGWGSR
ncbi:cytidine deaminase [Streptomyces sp. B21-108]|uniref:cytidine deaminase n=1 Tax=Streptomyces sp. B21-108 TaxID=3039419 RepID=UPI002FF150B3